MALNKINNLMVNNQANMWKYYYIATAGQTVFSGADANSNVLAVTSGSEEVTLNGVTLKPGTDYTISNNVITLTTGATLGSELNVTVYGIFNVADTYSISQIDNKVSAVQQGFYGFKNHIINGNFDIWQRGTSQTTYGYGSVDRWSTEGRQGATLTVNKGSTSSIYPTIPTNNFANIQLTPTNYANDSVERGIFFNQWVENGFRNLIGKTVTISILADTNQDFVIGFGNSDSTSSQGGNDPGWRKIVSKKFTAIPGVNKYTYTFTMPSTLTPGTFEHKDHLLVWFCFGCNQYYADDGYGVGKITAFNTTGTYFNLLQAQLEEGSVATPFEQRPYGLELSLCQRYYEVADSAFQGYAGVNGEIWGYRQNLKVAKRVTPTLVTSSAAQVNCGVSAPGNGMYDTFIFNAIVTAIGAFSGTLQVTASAEL